MLRSLLSREPEPASPPTYDELDPDEFFEVTSSARRRMLLELLAEFSGPVEQRDATDMIATVEADGTPTSEDEKRVYVSLYQTHLPKLDEWGYVDWDRESGEITPTDAGAQAAALFEDIEARVVGDDD